MYKSKYWSFAAIALLAATLLMACAQPTLPQPTSLTRTTTASSVSPTSLPPPATSEVSSNEAKVIRVIDGDTIEADINGKIFKVRYIGIDTPELNEVRADLRALANKAASVNAGLVEGKLVRLEKDVSETDQYGRLLRYVFSGDLFVNAELVRLGYAQVVNYPPDVKYHESFLKLQSEAKRARQELWALSTPLPSSQLPQAPNPTPATSPSQAPTTAASPALSLQIVSVTSPIRRGASATLDANASRGAQCTIAVYYKSGASTAQGLYPKNADASGYVSWTWRVGTNTTLGSWPIVVTAKLGSQTVSQTAYFTVQ